MSANFDSRLAEIRQAFKHFYSCTNQKNFKCVDIPGFIYADTDAIHCELPVKQDGTPDSVEEFLVSVGFNQYMQPVLENYKHLSGNAENHIKETENEP